VAGLRPLVIAFANFSLALACRFLVAGHILGTKAFKGFVVLTRGA